MGRKVKPSSDVTRRALGKEMEVCLLAIQEDAM
jgi:hypothetical protein